MAECADFLDNRGFLGYSFICFSCNHPSPSRVSDFLAYCCFFNHTSLSFMIH